MNFHHGWLDSCHAITSNHYHISPFPNPLKSVRLVVLHCISLPSGEYANHSVEHLFTNDTRASDSGMIQEIVAAHGRVSAHFYIKRSGERIQFIPVHCCAWHAGISSYQGEENCNNFSIGIELQGTVGEAFTLGQYQSLRHIVIALQEKFPRLINSTENIVAHSDIAPERKQDPGKGFEWDYFLQLL